MEAAVGAFDRHPRPGPHVRDTPAGVAQVLDGDPQRVAGGCRRERVRVAAGPARRVEEPPDEELPRGDGEPVEAAAGHHDRHDLVALADDVDDAQPVAQGPVQRNADPPDQNRAGRGAPERPPVDRGDGGRHELLAGPELVRQGETDAEVRIQVQQVPRLVPQLPARLADAGHGDEQEQRRAGDGQQDAGVVDDEVPGLGEHVGPCLDRVPDRHDDDVDDHQVDRPEPDETVSAGGSSWP